MLLGKRSCVSFFLGCISLSTAKEYYLKTDAPPGGAGDSASSPFNDASVAIKSLGPGDTLYLMGTITNPSYDPTFKDTWRRGVNNEHLWLSENTLNLRYVKGTANARIKIMPAPGMEHSTVLRGDGQNIVRLHGCEYIDVLGLNVYGEVENISIDTAKKLQFAYRDLRPTEDPTVTLFRVDKSYKKYTDLENVNMTEEELAGLKDLEPVFKSGEVQRPSYTDTRGIYISKSYEITVQNCEVHHMPGGGIRISDSEYVDIIENNVHDVSRKSYSGTHGIVATNTLDERGGVRTGQAKYRTRILGNTVHHNYNEIYSWAPTKDEIHPKIDEGKGISLQRNQKWKYGGRILVANNVAYYNGYSGIHSNDGDNIDFFSNTAYMNSYTSTITYGYHVGANNIGISISDGDDCKIGNNIAVVDSDVGGFAISVVGATNADIHTNIVWGVGEASLRFDVDVEAIERNPIHADPNFENPPSSLYAMEFSFAPLSSSPAIGAGKPRYATDDDYLGHIRDASNPTIGAIENFPGCLVDGQGTCDHTDDCCSGLVCKGDGLCSSN